MTDKKFILDSIKMDLYRVVTAAGDITKSINEFLEHVNRSFEKIPLDDRETTLKNQLLDIILSLKDINDPLSRLRWVENVMTVRCRL